MKGGTDPHLDTDSDGVSDSDCDTGADPKPGTDPELQQAWQQHHQDGSREAWVRSQEADLSSCGTLFCNPAMQNSDGSPHVGCPYTTDKPSYTGPPGQRKQVGSTVTYEPCSMDGYLHSHQWTLTHSEEADEPVPRGHALEESLSECCTYKARQQIANATAAGESTTHTPICLTQDLAVEDMRSPQLTPAIGTFQQQALPADMDHRRRAGRSLTPLVHQSNLKNLTDTDNNVLHM